MTQSLISVIIPSFNYGHFVCGAVRSALAQTYPHIEVIVVDDGSTDDTRERLAPFGERIRYHHKENQGLSAARNTGIQLAQGEFLAFLDSDDIWHPQKLAIQMQAVARHPHVSLIATGNCMELSEEWPDLAEDTELPLTAITLEDLIIKSRFSPSSVLLRKDCLESDDPFDTSLRSVEDRDLWIRIAWRSGILRIDFPLIYTRLHKGNMSRAAVHMEQYEHLVLRRAFASIPALRQRWLLRSKAFSMASYSAAFMYREGGVFGKTILRLGRSFLFWPFPYKRSEVRMSSARLKLLGMTVWRMARGLGAEAM